MRVLIPAGERRIVAIAAARALRRQGIRIAHGAANLGLGEALHHGEHARRGATAHAAVAGEEAVVGLPEVDTPLSKVVVEEEYT